MEIQKTLKEIAKYVASRILNNDFEFVECNEHHSILKIDNSDFEIWTSNGAHWLDFSNCNTFIRDVNVFLFENEEDKEIAWNILEPHIIKYKKNVLLAQKIKELETLENL